MQTIKTLISENSDVYSSYLPWKYDLFNNTSNYEINLEIETQSGTGEGITVNLVKDFNVKYPPLALAFKPIVTELPEVSGVKLDWSQLSQNPGVIMGNQSNLKILV